MLKSQILQGNEACVKGAIAAGCRFYAGYPITPASEIAQLMSSELPTVDGTFIQMEDEIGSMGAIIGASLTGVKSMTATSGPGFSLMQENIGFASITEVPCVIIEVMRGGPSTGAPTLPSQGDVMQARWGTHGDHPMIVLSPSSVEECFSHTVRAFNLSERYRTPVIVLIDETTVHLREKMSIPSDDQIDLIQRQKPTEPPEWFVAYKDPGNGVPPMPNYGDGYRHHVTGLIHDERGYPTTRHDEIEPFMLRLFSKISRDFASLQFVKTYFTDDARLTIVAYGTVARAALKAVKDAREEGLKVGLINLQILFPFPRQSVSPILQRSNIVLVPEMNMGQISREVKRVSKSGCRIETLNKINYDVITPDEILVKIKEIYGS